MADIKIYPITPVPAPRQTQSDGWKNKKTRPEVARYRAFKEHCKLLNMRVNSGDFLVFYMPMPKSWPKYKRASHAGMPHKQTPDKDNMEKAVLDAIYGDDSHIYLIGGMKLWSYEGGIAVFKNKLKDIEGEIYGYTGGHSRA